MKMNKEVVIVRLSDIIPNRFQPRLTFDEEALNELSSSIREHGIIQPLILRDLGSKYEIIAGERRYKAATLAGLTEVPAIIGSMDDQTSAELALIENIQRKDLTAIEEAKSYKKILEMGNFTQEELAKRMGKSQPTIANKMRLLSLTNEVQIALMNNLISERHARCLLQVKDENMQKEVLNKIINERMNVRDTDEYIKSLIGISKDVSQPDTPINNTPVNNAPIEVSFDNSISEVNTNENISLETPINNSEVNIPLFPENNSVNNSIQNDNPNVYLQSNNSDVVDISNLNNEIPNKIDEVLPKSNSIQSENLNYEDNKEEIPMLNEQTLVLPQDNIVKEEDQGVDNNDSLYKLKYATFIKLAKDTLEQTKKFGYNAKLEEKKLPNGYEIIIKVEE